MDSFFHKGKNNQLVVAFHGTGGNEYQLLSTTATLFPEASVIGFLGNVGTGEQRRFFSPLAAGKLDREQFNQQTSAFLANEWPEISAENYQEIILLGYSNGANFILGLLEKIPALAATAILLHPSNLDYQFAGDTQQAKIILTTGAQDGQSLPGDVLQLKSQLQTHFADVELIIADGGHQLTAQELDEIKELL